MQNAKRKVQMPGVGRFLLYALLLLLATLFWFSLPRPLFSDPYSTVLLDHDGNLLGAKISADQQWRFPECEQVPEKFRLAITHYEDRYFYFHPALF